jgi:hypothetical protein
MGGIFYFISKLMPHFLQARDFEDTTPMLAPFIGLLLFGLLILVALYLLIAKLYSPRPQQPAVPNNTPPRAPFTIDLRLVHAIGYVIVFLIILIIINGGPLDQYMEFRMDYQNLKVLKFLANILAIGGMVYLPIRAYA